MLHRSFIFTARAMPADRDHLSGPPTWLLLYEQQPWPSAGLAYVIVRSSIVASTFRTSGVRALDLLRRRS